MMNLSLRQWLRAIQYSVDGTVSEMMNGYVEQKLMRCLLCRIVDTAMIQFPWNTNMTNPDSGYKAS